jgi:hypothetical protein
MTIQMLPLWELVLDGTQIFLCAIAILFLLHNKIKYKRWILTAPPKDNADAFSIEMHVQNLKQQTEQTLDKIIDVINQERVALQPHYDLADDKHEIKVPVIEPSARIKTSAQADHNSDSDAGITNFGEILDLSKKGLSTREISQRVNMPRGEVELILRLNKQDAEDKQRSTIRARA